VSGCDACLVYLVESETGEFVLRASQVPHAHDLGHLRMKMGEGVTGWWPNISPAWRWQPMPRPTRDQDFSRTD